MNSPGVRPTGHPNLPKVSKIGAFRVSFGYGKWRVARGFEDKFLGSFDSEEVAREFASGLVERFEAGGYTPKMEGTSDEHWAKWRRLADENLAAARASRARRLAVRRRA